jgi:predicted AAA+ superfamily ATPase
MFQRKLLKVLSRFEKSFPVVAITGARQSGRTTLARSFFSKLDYVSLEDPIKLSFAQEDPRGLLARFDKGAIFDEVQRWPDLFSYLQGIVDEDRMLGRFVW